MLVSSDIAWSLHESRWEDLGQLLEEDPYLDSLIEKLRTQQMNMGLGKQGKARRLGKQSQQGATMALLWPTIKADGRFKRNYY